MASKDDAPIDIGRREFLIMAGAVLAVGMVAGLAACTPDHSQEEEISVPADLITHDPEKCAGCGTCVLMCSLTHEGEAGPAVSRMILDRDPFSATYAFYNCQECRSPNCYYACPNKDTARCIDQTTGVVYVNADRCPGCGKCIKACPFEPARTRLNPVTKVSMKCDLCRDRKGGPVCVQYCGMNALSITPGAERV